MSHISRVVSAGALLAVAGVPCGHVLNTCFALLFLDRATLTATTPR